MTYNPTKTRTWSRTTPADGDLIDDEVDRIYGNTEDLKAALEAALNKQIPLGSVVADNLDFLDATAFPLADGTAKLRTLFDPALLAKLLKTVTSITPGTDRVNVPSGHGKAEADVVKFGFTGGGITALTEYFVRNPTTNDFQVSLTATGSIIDLTSDQTGEMLTDVAWGFGNGSTTLNVPDERGIGSRGAGVSGQFQKANGSYYDGGNPGQLLHEQTMAHYHQGYNYTGAGALRGFGADATNNGPSVVHTADYVKEVKSDGTSGPPRTGDETRGVTRARKMKVRIA